MTDKLINKKYWKQFTKEDIGILHMQRWNGGGTGLRVDRSTYRSTYFISIKNISNVNQKYPWIFYKVSSGKQTSKKGPFYKIRDWYVQVSDWNAFYPDIDELYMNDIAHISPTEANTFENTEETEIKTAEKAITDFIYKIDDSKTLKIDNSYNSIKEFFESDFKYNDKLTIYTVDTKTPIIILEKIQNNNKNMFKFVVDITNKHNDVFTIKTTFTTQDKFNSLLQSTINALKEYNEFYNYAEDLESCL